MSLAASMLIRHWRIGLLALAAALIWWGGYTTGRDRCTARHEAALIAAQRAAMRAADEAGRKEAARLTLQADLDAIHRELEDAANAEAAANPSCLGVDRVRRLNRY